MNRPPTRNASILITIILPAAFGTSDGYIYCLKQSDGALCWRFNANPAYRRIISFGQIESAWPIHGSVLVHQNSVVFVAGRSTFIDGGLAKSLDTETGKVMVAAELPAAPMWDGMAVADQALFICPQDGRIIRLE